MLNIIYHTIMLPNPLFQRIGKRLKANLWNRFCINNVKHCFIKRFCEVDFSDGLRINIKTEFVPGSEICIDYGNFYLNCKFYFQHFSFFIRRAIKGARHRIPNVFRHYCSTKHRNDHYISFWQESRRKIRIDPYGGPPELSST